MKRNILICALTFVTGALIAADAKSDVSGAIKALAEKGNYSWKSTVEMGGGGAAGGGGGRGGAGGGRFGGGPTEGKIDKDGTAMLSMTRGENKTEIVIKGGKGAIKGPEGWQSTAEAADAGGGGGGGAGGRGNPGRMMARMVETFKAPATQAQDILAKTGEVKKSDDGYTGDLTEAGAKELLTMGGGRAGGGNGPEISDPKGTAKFWVKDGVLSKYEVHVTGSMSFNGNERKMDRTTKVEFSDVGTTKVSVPEAASKKL